MNRTKSLCCGAPLEAINIYQHTSVPKERSSYMDSSTEEEELTIEVFKYENNKKTDFNLEYSRCTQCGMLFTYAN